MQVGRKKIKRSILIERFIAAPLELIDLLDQVIKRKMLKKPLEEKGYKVLQLNEIAKTIDRLKEGGAEIPDELRRLKIELSHEVEEYETASAKYQETIILFQELEGRLANSLAEVRAILSGLKNSNNGKQKVRRYVKRTSPNILAKEIRKALRELGGSAKKSEVLKKIKINMEGKFKPQDLEKDSRKNVNWEKWVVAEKNKMANAGILKSGTKFGVWELRRK